MDSSATSKRRSHGWWRLWTGILLIFGVTLGLGFYLPLYKTHQLLKAELAQARTAATQLTESLARAEASVERVTKERAELSKFKEDVASAGRRYPELAQRFISEALPLVKAALDAKGIRAMALDDGVGITWASPALLNRKRDALSGNGQKLLCSMVRQAAGAGLPDVTVRTFAPPAATAKDVAAGYGSATTLGVGVAEQLVGACSLAASNVSLASSPASEDGAPLRLEFRPGAASPAVGL